MYWRKWEEGNWLEAVDLLDAAALYRLLKRQPLAEQQQALRTLLAEYVPVQGWLADWLAWLEQQLIQQRSIQPLDLTDPAWNRDVLRAIYGLTQLETPILERLFSVGWLGQSKRFSELEGAVLRVCANLPRKPSNLATMIGLCCKPLISKKCQNMCYLLAIYNWNCMGIGWN